MLTLTATIPDGPSGPKLKLSHWIAIGLELSIITLFLIKGSILGFVLCLIYGVRFSATRSGLEVLKGD